MSRRSQGPETSLLEGPRSQNPYQIWIYSPEPAIVMYPDPPGNIRLQGAAIPSNHGLAVLAGASKPRRLRLAYVGALQILPLCWGPFHVCRTFPFQRIA